MHNMKMSPNTIIELAMCVAAFVTKFLKNQDLRTNRRSSDCCPFRSGKEIPYCCE